MSFVIRKFNYTESLGEKLKAIRRSAGLTLSEMAAKTKIRKSYLHALETGNYSSLPDPVYTRNFLKIYVRALGGDVTYFVEQFESECGTCDFTQNARLPRRRAQALQFLVASRFVKIAIVGVVAIGIMSYFGYQIQAIISPPVLTVYEPADELLTNQAIITVTGHVEAGASVRVNEVDVLLSKDGSFEVDVALERGLNVITIESQKRYSQPAIEYRRVVLQRHYSMHTSVVSGY